MNSAPKDKSAVQEDNLLKESNPFLSLINPCILNLTESPTLTINELSKKLIAEGKSIYRFGLGQSPFPVPDTVVDALKLYAPQKDYLPVKGLLTLRESIAEFHRKKDFVDAQAENVIVGPGSKELLFLLQLVFSGKLLVVSPSWVSYVPQAKILKKEIGVIPTSYEDKWILTPKAFKKFLETEDSHKTTPRLLVLNYPGNPDGMSYEEKDLQQIANIAKENNIYILSDEIYGQLHHQGNHISIARFYPEGTIISSGLSKWCGAGGWRLGSFTFPHQLKPILEAMCVVASETYTSVSAPIQYAAIQAFRGGMVIEQYLWHVRRILKQLGNLSFEILNNGGIKLYPPIGGFYLFLDFSPFKEKLSQRGIHTSEELCKRLLEDAGIAILPGSAFNQPPHYLTARLAYVDFDGAKYLSSSTTIALNEPLPHEFPRLWSSKVVEGCEKIIEWLNQ